MRTGRKRTPEMCTPWQALAYAIWDVDEAAEVARGPLPLGAGASLTWLAFSAEGLLTAMDSDGRAPFSSMDFRVCAILAASSACPEGTTSSLHCGWPSASCLPLVLRNGACGAVRWSQRGVWPLGIHERNVIHGRPWPMMSTQRRPRLTK